jgi:glutamyl-tRNA synthetase
VTTFADFYFKDTVELDAEILRKDFPAELQPKLRHLRDSLSMLLKFDADTLNRTTKEAAGQLGVGIGVLVHPLRLLCTGRTVGPSLYHLMEVLGKERVVARFDGVMGRMQG